MHLVFTIDAACLDSGGSSLGSSRKNVRGGVYVILQFSFSGMRSYIVHWNFFWYEILYCTLEWYLIVNTVKGHRSLGLKIRITQPDHCALHLAACSINRSCLSTDLANKTLFPYLWFFTKNIV